MIIYCNAALSPFLCKNMNAAKSHLHLTDAFIQSNLQCIQVIHLYCQLCVFPGNRTHNLCAANAMLYHWATGTLLLEHRKSVAQEVCCTGSLLLETKKTSWKHSEPRKRHCFSSAFRKCNSRLSETRTNVFHLIVHNHWNQTQPIQKIQPIQPIQCTD